MADTTITKQTWNNKVVVTSDLISVIDILILNTLSMTTKEVADGGQKLRLLRLGQRRKMTLRKLELRLGRRRDMSLEARWRH